MDCMAVTAAVRENCLSSGVWGEPWPHNKNSEIYGVEDVVLA